MAKHNTLKLDAIREEIEQLSLNSVKKQLLTSLILAMDEVDSTIGHYASYLSEWSPRSYRQMKLRIPRIIPKAREHEIHQATSSTSLRRSTPTSPDRSAIRFEQRQDAALAYALRGLLSPLELDMPFR